MATTTENICLPAKVNLHELKKADSGNLGGVCNEMKEQRKSAPAEARGLERPTTTDPTCCPRYPPGTTLLECRFEGDEPVAHVVQVASNGKTATQKMCLLVETKQSSSGPYSRIISRPIEYPKDSNQCNGSRQPQTAFRLESREYHEGPVATITKAPIADCTGDLKEIMTFETNKGEGQPDGPTSRILYGPSIGESNCAESPRDLPACIIECRSTAKKTLARISRCPDVSSHKPGDSTMGLHDTIETRIDKNGPKAYAINFFEDMEKSPAKKRIKSTSNGQSAKHRQQPKRRRSETLKSSSSNCSPTKCLTICPASKKLEPPMKRRNGLDSVDNLPVSLFNRMPRSEDCPCSSSKGKCRSGSSLPERGQRAPSESSKLFKCVLVPCTVAEKLVRENDKLSEDRPRPKVSSQMKMRDVEVRKLSEDCTRPKTSSIMEVDKNGSQSEAKTISKRERFSTENWSKDFVPEIRSQELLTRFRDYFSPHQLQRYEVCRSKRNGLQDQCQLPIPRAVLELKKKEMLSRDSRRKSDSPESTQSTILACNDRNSIANCDTNLKEYVESTRRPPVQSSTKKQIKRKAIKSVKSEEKSKKLEQRQNGHQLKAVKSRELYAGAVYIDCDCYHRNGLQHECPRTSCGGRLCRVKPWPKCDLASYFMNKWEKYYEHLDRIPPTTFCGPHKAWLRFLEEEEEKSRKLCEEQEARKKIDTKSISSKKSDKKQVTPSYREKLNESTTQCMILYQ